MSKGYTIDSPLLKQCWSWIGVVVLLLPKKTGSILDVDVVDKETLTSQTNFEYSNSYLLLLQLLSFVKQNSARSKQNSNRKTKTGILALVTFVPLKQIVSLRSYYSIFSYLLSFQDFAVILLFTSLFSSLFSLSFFTLCLL